MRKLIVALFLLAGFPAHSQADLGLLLATSPGSDVSKVVAREKIESLIKVLHTSRVSDQRLLKKAFHRVHSEFLRKYEAYADFNNLFTAGQYDCLTAIALFSLVLDEFNFSYEIIETNYHIFMIVKTTQGDVLLETTDRFGGFVTGKEKIARRTGDYRKNQLTADLPGRISQAYSFKLYQGISPEKLTALLYFNQAVKTYNQRDFISSSKALEKSQALDASSRCDELGALLIRTVLESSMDEKTKSICLVHLKSFWIRKPVPLASN